MPMAHFKRVPAFRSEAEEREFWATADSTEYVDWSKAKRVVFPNLKPSTTTISIRLPETLLSELRLLANERDVPYQSLLKVYLADRVASERGLRGQRPHSRLLPTGQKPKRKVATQKARG